MEAFAWNHHFTGRLEPIDGQHHFLVELTNRLGDAMEAGTDIGQVSLGQIFNQLVDHARQYFAAEENLMDKLQVEARHRDTHCQQHHDFLEQLMTLWNSHTSMSNPTKSLHAFLCYWLGSHTLVMDGKLAQQATLIKGGVTPEAAYEQVSCRGQDDNLASLLQVVRNLYRNMSLQSQELVEARVSLEETIAERTRQLAAANESLRSLNRQLESLSKTDALTGIANRRYFDDRLQDEWLCACRSRQPLSLLMIDIDYFKPYNDNYGHMAGDQCLQMVTAIIQTALRRPGDLLARYGGEEMVVVLPNTDHNGALRVAAAIQQELERKHIPHAHSPTAPHVTLSIGVATALPEQREGWDKLIAAADAGLYDAKENGRNCTRALAEAVG